MTAGHSEAGGTRTVSVRDRLRYKVDEVLARGTLGVIMWLAAMTVAVVLVAAVVLGVSSSGFTADAEAGFVEGAWQSLMRTLDPGTMSDDAGWTVRIVALLVTLAGIFLVAALIGIIATGLDTKIDELRKGRSFVVERGHTVILGWSPRIFTVVSEVTIANENHPGLAIVVLADRDKTEMEDELRSRVGDLRGSKLVVRSGDPGTPADLGIVNIDDARSVVVLGDDVEGDADIVKAVLALAATDAAIGRAHVVAEVGDPRTARALDAAFGRDVLTVQSAEVVARVTAQSCRQAGLSAVVHELLDFDGDEIYFADAGEVVGHTFGEVLNAYATSTVIGRRAADGTITVCPPMGTVFEAGDQIIAVSADDDTVTFGGWRTVEPLSGALAGDLAVDTERILIVGWNGLGTKILRELDTYVAPGSCADILADPALAQPSARDLTGCSNIAVEVLRSEDEVEDLPRLAGTGGYSSVIILGYRVGLSPDEADSRSLLAMLLIRRGLSDHDVARPPRVIVELLDARAADLARVTGADDFVVSDALASLMMSQLSEHPELDEVFRQIYTADGCSLRMVSADPFIGVGAVSFDQVVATVAVDAQLAIGWRRAADGEVVVNPPKSQVVTFAPDDHLVVIG